MKLIEHWGERMSGYVPDRPQKSRKVQRNAAPYFNSIGRVEKYWKTS